MTEILAYDSMQFEESARTIDDNGFLHVTGCNITKEQVAPYFGREIPNWQRLGLNPDSIYKLYRPAAELKKAVEGLPKGVKDSLKTMVATMITSGSFDSMNKIKILDELLDTQMAQTLFNA